MRRGRARVWAVAVLVVGLIGLTTAVAHAQDKGPNTGILQELGATFAENLTVIYTAYMSPNTEVIGTIGIALTY